MDVAVAEGFAEFLLQHMLNACDHKVHERLRCIDNTVCVGHLDTEPLKEAFIYGVEKCLLLVEISDGSGGIFNCAVKMFQAFTEIVPAEHPGI